MENLIHKKNKWQEIDLTILRRCRRRWNGQGEDVYSAAKVLFFGRNFMPQNRRHAEARAMLFAREAARKLLRWQHTAEGVVILPPPSKKVAPKKPDGNHEMRDPRIDMIVGETLDSRVSQVIHAVRGGETITAACCAAGISYIDWRRTAMEIYLQPRLFQEGRYE